MKLSKNEQEGLGQILCDVCMEFEFIYEHNPENDERLCEKCSEERFEAYYE